jgi:hypothetical protein
MSASIQRQTDTARIIRDVRRNHLLHAWVVLAAHWATADAAEASQRARTDHRE